MRSSFDSRNGFVLVRSPNYRHQQTRRRLLIVSAVLGLALASGVIGSMTGPRIDPQAHVSTGPFSYFPSE
jgi:hypothetical protein